MKPKNSDSGKEKGPSHASRKPKAQTPRKPKAETTKKRERIPSPKSDKRTGSARRSGQSITTHRAPNPEELRAEIAKRAYELYERRGWNHGQDMNDWLNAEQQVLAQDSFVGTLAH